MDDVLQRYVRAGEFSGVVLVANNGEVVFRRAYGLANRELGIPNSVDTPFRIASLSKLLTRTAVLALQDKGMLRTDAPIARVLPDYPAGGQILISHLIEHTSGIPDIHNGDPEFTRPESLRQSRSLPELVKVFRSRPLRFAPGTRMQYSNSGYILLAQILETASGNTYSGVLSKTVLSPAKMSRSGVDTGRPIPGGARGYSRSGLEIRPAPDYEMSNYVGSGNAYATVDDLFRWEEALTKGQLLKDEGVRQFGSINHLGRIAGFRSALYRFPSHVIPRDPGLVIVILSNLEEAPAQAIAGDVLAAFLLQKAQPLPAEMQSKLAGTYSGQGPNGPIFRLRLFSDGQRLWMSYSNHTAQLLYLGGAYLYALENSRLQPLTIRAEQPTGTPGVYTLVVDEGSTVLRLSK